MLNVSEKHLAMLAEIFSSYCPKAEIWAYGSRVKNDSHSGSDLDLAVKDFGERGKTVEELRELLRESNIPFLVDINEFDRLPAFFREEILKKYVVIFPA